MNIPEKREPPGEDALDEWLGTWGGGMFMGGISGHDFAFPLEGKEEIALAEEHRAALARKRPCGFAPWPEEAS